MNLLCPECCSEEAAPADRGTRLKCGNCGATFRREEALVTAAEAEAHAEKVSACTCDDVHGCPQCFQRADGLVGATVRDSRAASGRWGTSAKRTASRRSPAAAAGIAPTRSRCCMRRRSRSEGATELRCPACGSENVACERDAMLVADVVALRAKALILSGPPVPRRLDDVRLVCADCATELEGVEWAEERPQHVPDGRLPLTDARALDALAAELTNQPGDWNGADVCELAADLLRCTGRLIEDEPDDEGIWR